jgi:hypothetical protein
MKKEIKLMRDAINEKNIRHFLSALNVLQKEEIEEIDNQSGMNMIHYCAEKNAAKELLLIINYLRNLNLDCKCSGIIQKTAVEIAISMHHKEVSFVLIKNGANLKDVETAQKVFKNDKEFENLLDDMKIKKKRGFFNFG